MDVTELSDFTNSRPASIIIDIYGRLQRHPDSKAILDELGVEQDDDLREVLDLRILFGKIN